jgi:hypothetical protein
MKIDQCEVGLTVKIDFPDNPVIHGEIGTIVAIPERDEIVIQLNRMKPEYNNYEDTRTGFVTVSSDNISVI